MYFGCIADDFTGAADAASFLQKGGMEVVLVSGIPENRGKGGFADDVNGVVIALKSRALPPREAVDQSFKAARWLKEAGAEQIYVKYCSTFDSTEKGNIGPVCDRLLEWSGQQFTLLCPSMPSNGRTVKDGILYVDKVPLAESPMRHHPVNPMKKSRIRDLMESQSEYPCYETRTDFAGLAKGEQEPAAGKGNQRHYYLIPDYETQQDGRAIVRQFGALGLLTGGSGLCEALAAYHVEKKGGGPSPETVSWKTAENKTGQRQKKGLILAGSCSRATRQQIEAWKRAGGSCLRIDPQQLLEDFSVLDQANKRIGDMDGQLLVYSALAAGDGDERGQAKNQAEGRQQNQAELSSVLDRAFSQLALYGRDCECEGIVVAGGETSGAVTKALGYQAFYVGDSIAPGVPILVPVEDRRVRLVLKSGNFGGERFFEEAKEAIC